MSSNRRRRLPPREDGHWHLDRKVPLALIFAIVAQGVAIVTWVNSVSFSVEQLTKELTTLKEDMKEGRSRYDAVISMQSDLKNLATSVGRLERYLEGRWMPGKPHGKEGQ